MACVQVDSDGCTPELKVYPQFKRGAVCARLISRSHLPVVARFAGALNPHVFLVHKARGRVNFSGVKFIRTHIGCDDEGALPI
jgi:hypothetical protein